MIRTRRSTLAVAAISSTVLAVGVLGLPSQAAPRTAQSGKTHTAAVRGGDGVARTPGNLDRRQLTGTLLARSSQAELDGRTKADKAYYRSLGTSAVADFDPLTKTVRNIGKLDGFLTGRSSAPARTIALGYVRSHLDALGLTGADLATFQFRQDYVDTIGIHHLSWIQTAAGTPVFGNGLKVNVTRGGQVISVQGSPISGLTALAAKAPGTRLTADQARGDAARNVHGAVARGTTVSSARSGSTAATTWNNHDYAKRVWFLTPTGLRPGWSTYVQATTGSFQHVVDSANGQTLFRRSTQDNAAGDAYVYDNYPGAPKGGKPKVVNLYKRHFLRRANHQLQGKSVIAWSDINDDNQVNSGEMVGVPGTKHGAQYKLTKFGSAASSLCSSDYQCTWNPHQANSWRKNRKADVTQAFYLASNFHNYLAKSPVGFTTQAGNFSRADNDPVLLNALDGANTLTDGSGNPVGLPDGNHIDNANMSTPPDGTPPTMQMYLFHASGATDAEDAYVPTSSAFDASVLYHEYTHGLSNRLVVDATGNSTLNDIESGAMGEAWSDYYAMDYLVTKGFVHDTNADGQVREGKYLIANQGTFRTMAIDCPVGSQAKACTSNYDGSHGGYTFGDFPTITGSPEVHSSGEIWAQTLWDLRKRLGHDVADNLITRGMSLSADNPSYLDMRNAIIQADQVAYGAGHTRVLWELFAHRGMGYFAGASSDGDTQPGEDFHTPPNPATAHDGTIAGFVHDPTTGDPVEGAVVQVTGQGNQFSDTTNANGFYEIDNLYTGTYAKVTASAPGYFGDSHPGQAVRIGDFTGGDLTNFAITRDWASTSGGANVVDYNGPNYAPQCGPDGAFDLSLSTGWGSTTGDNNGTPTNVFVPKHITVQLPKAVDITSFGVDPTATCGDGGSASTGDYKIETSTNGTTYVTAATGSFTSADRGQLNDVTLAPGTGTGVQYVRFTMLSNQTPDFATNCPNGAYSGCQFTDLTELAVFGS